MERVIIESPYAGDVEKNKRYLRACMRDCILRKESPYASHGLLTQEGVLRDEVSEERQLGIEAGFVWRVAANKTVVYVDLGISSGMYYGIEHAKKISHKVEYRSLGRDWEQQPKGKQMKYARALQARKEKQFKQGERDAIAGKPPATDELAYIQGFEKGLGSGVDTAQLLICAHNSRQRAARLETENLKLLAEIDEWKDASGLEKGGDPDAVTPDDLRNKIAHLRAAQEKSRGAADEALLVEHEAEMAKVYLAIEQFCRQCEYRPDPESCSDCPLQPYEGARNEGSIC